MYPGTTGACAVGVYQALLPRSREGPGDEAKDKRSRRNYI